jgi:hypothetical protein
MRISRAIVALVALACATAQAARPIAYWPMESLSDGAATDTSGEGHDALAYGLDGKLPEVVPGIAGNCLRLTAALEQYLEVSQTEQLLAPEAMTVMAWIKPIARDGTYEIIGNKGDKSGDGPWPGWRLRYTWSRAMFQFGAADSAEPEVISPDWSTPAGVWSHVALTYDGRTLTLYVDCEPIARQEASAPIMPAGRPLIIGNYSGRKNAYAFDGLIDEVRVYAEVLDAEAIYTEAAKGIAQQ